MAGKVKGTFKLGLKGSKLQINVSKRTLDAIGKWMQNKIRSNISKRIKPDGSPQTKNEASTIKIKRRYGAINGNHPGIWSGQLIDAIFTRSNIGRRTATVDIRKTRKNTWRKKGWNNKQIFDAFHGLNGMNIRPTKSGKVKRYPFWGFPCNNAMYNTFRQFFYSKSTWDIKLRG